MRIRMPLALPLLVVVLSACAAATRPVPGPAPAVSGYEARIDSIFAHFGPATPGCAVGVYRAGDVVFAKGYGMANLEHAIPITPETVFDIASISKQFTAFAIHLLARQGRLSLDDDVRKHVPEVPDFGGVITLRHLLHNTSGLRWFSDLRMLADPRWNHEQPFSRREIMEMLARQRTLSFPPGEDYTYSNTNWVLLAMIVERVDGRAFRDFMEQEVFRRLGMTSTIVRDDPMRLMNGRASYYIPLEGGGYGIHLSWQLASEVGGPGMVHSTIADMARWDANFYDERLGGPGIAETMYTRGVLNSGDTIAYASGLYVGRYQGLPNVGHGGATGGTSHLLRFPEQRLTVAVLCNQYYTHTPAYEYAQRVAGTFLPPASTAARAVVLDSAALVPFAGRFTNPETGETTEFFVHEGVLAERDGAVTYPLVALGDGRFEDDYVHLEFVAAGSEVSGLNKLSGLRWRLVRAHGDPWSPTAADLMPYAGIYASDELEVTWEIAIVEDALTLRRRGGMDLVLQPVAPDRFRTEGGLRIQFARDSEQSITGLSVGTGIPLNIVFTRFSDR